MSCKNLNEGYIKRNYIGISERNLRKIIISKWKRVIRTQLTNIWRRILRVTFLHDQVLRTKCPKNRLDRDIRKQPTRNNKFRLCETKKEDVGHIIKGCLNMSSSYYLPLWHDTVAKYLIQAHVKKIIQGFQWKITNSCSKSANMNTGGASPLKLLQKYHTTNQM